MEERIIELEKKVAFQDDTIEQLNQALIDQQKRIEQMEAQLKAFQDRIAGEEFVRPQQDEEPPPHY